MTGFDCCNFMKVKLTVQGFCFRPGQLSGQRVDPRFKALHNWN